MELRNFEEMYVAELQEARSFEEMMEVDLPEFAEKASEPELRQTIERHRDETQRHMAAVSTLLQRRSLPAEHVDGSMRSMLAEAEKMVSMTESGPLRDAAIIASLQRIKHYEIAVYGTLASYAHGLGLEEDKNILGAILEDEKATDAALTAVARRVVNPQALNKAA